MSDESSKTRTNQIRNANVTPLAPAEMRSGPNRLSLQTEAGGEIQISEYLHGDRLTLQDSSWQDVSFDDTSGFEYPNWELNEDYRKLLLEQNDQERRGAAQFDASEAAGLLLEEMRLIAAETKAARLSQASNRWVKLSRALARLASKTGVRLNPPNGASTRSK